MPMGPHSIPMRPGFSPFFWIFPLIVLVILVILAYVMKRALQNHNSQTSSEESRWKKNSKAGQFSTVEVPEELRTKAKQMMEEIDWDIRFLEKQLETEKDKEERKRLQREIEKKRRQYRSIVDRFG